VSRNAGRGCLTAIDPAAVVAERTDRVAAWISDVTRRGQTLAVRFTGGDCAGQPRPARRGRATGIAEGAQTHAVSFGGTIFVHACDRAIAST
jgi:hypothetical protein